MIERSLPAFKKLAADIFPLKGASRNGRKA
jgi:hypothetical protein